MKWREREKIDYKLNKDEREKGEKEAWSIWIGDSTGNGKSAPCMLGK